MSYAGEHIWIIGASSGIGKSLALELGKQGASLTLSARREPQLKKVATEIQQLNPNSAVHIEPLDIVSEEKVFKAAHNITKKAGTIDRIIFMAAIYTEPGLVKDIDIETAKNIFDVNFIGALTVSKCALSLFENQESGQLALCSSVAGYIGLPRGQIYSASKAALINLTESLASEAPDHVDIKLINPGFVETPMTNQNDFDMPMIITAQQAALAIARGLKSSGFEIHFPKKFTLFMKLLKSLPYALALRMTRRMTP